MVIFYVQSCLPLVYECQDWVSSCETVGYAVMCLWSLIAVLVTKLGDGKKGTREPAMLLWYPGAQFAPNYYLLSLPWEMWIFPLLSERTPVFSFFLSTNILSCMVELSYSWFQSCQMTRMGCVKYMLEFY